MNLYPFAKAVLCVLAHIFYNIKYEGLEKIPADGGFIVSCNHQSFFDPVFLAKALKPQLHFMAKSEFYDKKLVGWLFSSLGAFPVNRGKGDRAALDASKKYIEEGGTVAIFPEGSRSPDGNPQRAKPGAAMIAGMVGCGVQPVGISYKGKLSFRKKVTVRFGKFLAPGDLGIDPKSLSTVRKASHIIMDAVIAEMDRECFDYAAYAAQREGDRR